MKWQSNVTKHLNSNQYNVSKVKVCEFEKNKVMFRFNFTYTGYMQT